MVTHLIRSQCVKNMYRNISGDKWGEIDTRFSFCAVACLSLLNRMDAINVDKAVEFVKSCMNFDGGFGSRPLSESHAGLVYCCVGFLSVTNRLDLIEADKLGWWLCERQLPSGGLNGNNYNIPHSKIFQSLSFRSSGEVARRLLLLVGVIVARYNREASLDRREGSGDVRTRVSGHGDGRLQRQARGYARSVPHALRTSGVVAPGA